VILLKSKFEEENLQQDLSLLRKLKNNMNFEDPFSFDEYKAIWMKHFPRKFSIEVSNLIQNHLIQINEMKNKTSRNALFDLLEEEFENYENDLNLLHNIKPELNFENPFDINVYSGVFYKHMINGPIEVQSPGIPNNVQIVRKRNRFGDGLEKITVNKVEFFPSDYVPKKTHCEVIKDQVGLSLCNTALTSAHNLQESILSKEQAALIYVYTVESPFYPSLNNAMRSGTIEERNVFQDFIYYLTNALELLDPFVGPVYRGIDCQISEYTCGKTIVWPSFSSSTKDPKVAIEFLKGKQGTLFLINSKTARSIDKYSAIKTEQEVLFLPNSLFKIYSQVTDAGKKMLETLLSSGGQQVSLKEIVVFELNEI